MPLPASPIIVALDGPAGAGKSSLARALARRLGYRHVDTGAIYRAIALRAQRLGVAWDDDAALQRVVAEARIEFVFDADGARVLVDGVDVTTAIRAPEISLGASTVSARPPVRAGLLELQRRLARMDGAPGAVLEGRDIGTVVFPDAHAKFYVDASLEERARRRQLELRERGGDVPSLEETRRDVRQRDHDDETRPIAPLRAAADATRVDTTGRRFETVLAYLEAAVRARTTGAAPPEHPAPDAT